MGAPDRFSDIKRYYEEYYTAHREKSFPADPRRTMVILEPIVRDAAHGAVFLDIGCGAGFACELLAQRGFKVRGVDIAESALAFARRRVPGGEFAPAADDGTLPFASESVDRVICLGVLEHVEQPERVIAQAWRVLQPHGRALFTVPNARHPYFLLAGGTGQILEVPRTRKAWESLFTAGGFAIRHISRDPGPSLRPDLPLQRKLKIGLHRLLYVLPLAFTYQFVFLLEKR